MYICEECGKIYEDEEAETVDEMPYGERHCGLGRPIWDMSRVEVETCSCGGELVKAKKCEKCDEFMPDNCHEVCATCRDEYATFDTVFEMGSDYATKITLNGFLTSVFTKEEIELILIDALKARDKDFIENKVKEYCDFDIDCFWGAADKKWKEER